MIGVKCIYILNTVSLNILLELELERGENRGNEDLIRMVYHWLFVLTVPTVNNYKRNVDFILPSVKIKIEQFQPVKTYITNLKAPE